MMTARELVGNWLKNQRNIGVRLEDKRNLIEDVIIITSMSDYGKNEIYFLGTYANTSGCSGYLKDIDSVSILEGEELTKLFSLYEKKQVENLHSQLSHSGYVGVLSEFFVEDEDGACIPSSAFLATRPSSSSKSWYDSKVDSHQNGVAGEIQTTYNSCLAITIDSLAYGLKHLSDSAKKLSSKAKVSAKSVMPISDAIMQASTDKMPTLGNATVSNAYGLKLNAPDPRTVPFRCAQSALQFQLYGFNNLTEERGKSIVMTLDATLGVACVSLLAGINHPDRVKLGGLPGDYRIVTSALEYFSLGNSWMIHPMIANLVFDFARKCAILGHKNLGKYWSASKEDVISCMMDLDVDKAHAIMDRNKDIMMKIFQAAWPICNVSNAAGVPNLSNEIKPDKARDVM